MKPMLGKEQKAYDKIKEIYEQYGGEVNEILYQYMKAYDEGWLIDQCLFLDELENVGLPNKHKQVVDFIINEIKFERW